MQLTVPRVTHVEGRGAAVMKQRGMSEATLCVNNPNSVCPSCTNLLPRMLPLGAKLTVISPCSVQTFVGAAR